MKLDQEKFENSINRLKTQYESGSLNIEEIYHILLGIKLDDEIDGDLYFKKEAFLDIYRVLSVGYKYLED